MADEPELHDTVVAAMTALGFDGTTLAMHPDSTIEPPPRHDSAGVRAVAALREEIAALGASLGAVELGETLGEGGMGLVRLGHQRRMGREVAVKSLKPDHQREDAALELLREAWVTGSLEHPNVVPVYDITLDENGQPSVVLKRIEGEDWQSLMHDANEVRERFGADDLLEWNLRVLLQVCQAVRFAHSHHIVHRDLKPENVRVGTFGEVYVLDWGIAVSLVDDGSGRFPLASEVRGLAGTPAYMAPEMLDDTPERLGPRTDVYLLGAILFEIIAGDAPHVGDTWQALISSILLSNPSYPAEVAPELQAIARRAMAREPGDRYQDVEAFRHAVEAFLGHREAVRLGARAARRHAELRRVARADGDALARREEAYRLFNECRFGFQSALEGWPDNERLRVELDAAIETMARYELAEDHPLAARSLLADMRAVPADLEGAIDDLAEAQREERAALEKIRADADPAAGRRTRGFLATLASTLWIILPAYAHLRHFVFEQPLSPWFGVVAGTAMVVVLGALGVWARESVMKTRINRQLAAAAMGGVLATIAANAAAMLLGGSIWMPLHDCLLVWAGLAFVVAFSVDLRLLIPSFAYVVAYLAVAAVGRDTVLIASSLTHVVLVLAVAVMWTRPGEDLRALGERRRTVPPPAG